jgi:hypothetical protein
LKDFFVEIHHRVQAGDQFEIGTEMSFSSTGSMQRSHAKKAAWLLKFFERQWGHAGP